MSSRARVLVGFTALVVATLGLRTVASGAEVDRPTWCGNVTYSGSNWHRFSDGNDCRTNPHVEDQAGNCNMAIHVAAPYCA